MVTISQPRKSLRPARSAGPTAWSRPRAWATASGACASGMPCLRSTISVSTPGSSSRPSTSTTRPAAGPPGPGQRWISTVTMSPSSADNVSARSTRTSVSSRASNGTTTAPRRASSRICPTTWALRRSRISRIRPSLRPSARVRSTRATTWSPCMAPARALSGTKTSPACAVVGQHEREAAGVTLQPSGDDVEAIGQGQSPAARPSPAPRRPPGSSAAAGTTRARSRGRRAARRGRVPSRANRRGCGWRAAGLDRSRRWRCRRHPTKPIRPARPGAPADRRRWCRWARARSRCRARRRTRSCRCDRGRPPAAPVRRSRPRVNVSGVDDGTGGVGRAVDAVGAHRQQHRRPGHRREVRRGGERELLVASAAAGAADPDGRLAAGDHGQRRGRLPRRRRHRLPPGRRRQPRLTGDGRIAHDHAVSPLARGPRRAVHGVAAAADDVGAGPPHRRVTGLRRLRLLPGAAGVGPGQDGRGVSLDAAEGMRGRRGRHARSRGRAHRGPSRSR